MCCRDCVGVGLCWFAQGLREVGWKLKFTGFNAGWWFTIAGEPLAGCIGGSTITNKGWSKDKKGSLPKYEDWTSLTGEIMIEGLFYKSGQPRL